MQVSPHDAPTWANASGQTAWQRPAYDPGSDPWGIGPPRQNRGGANFWIGEQGSFGKTLFDDKVAGTEVMKYPEGNTERKFAWARSTRNYLISKASEMEVMLKWSEDFQGAPILRQHIEAYGQSGLCLDHDPMKLSRDL